MQTSYSVYMQPAFVGGHGQLITVGTARNNSGVEIPYGRAVVHDAGTGTSDIAAKLPALITDVVKGFALYEHSHEPTAIGILDDKVFSLLRKGQIWVEIEQDMTPNDPVFVRMVVAGATGTSPAAGKVRKDADSSKAVAIPASVLIGGVAGGLAFIEVNIP